MPATARLKKEPPMRTIDWVDGAIELIDQTLLPHSVELLRVTELPALIVDIQRLAVRGAPALGVAGALGVALIAASVAAENGDEEFDQAEVRRQAALLREARPTARPSARVTPSRPWSCTLTASPDPVASARSMHGAFTGSAYQQWTWVVSCPRSRRAR